MINAHQAEQVRILQTLSRIQKWVDDEEEKFQIDLERSVYRKVLMEEATTTSLKADHALLVTDARRRAAAAKLKEAEARAEAHVLPEETS